MSVRETRVLQRPVQGRRMLTVERVCNLISDKFGSIAIDVVQRVASMNEKK